MPPLVIPALVVSTVVSTGLAVASAAGAFDPSPVPLPEPPDTPSRGEIFEGNRLRRQGVVQAQQFRRTVMAGASTAPFEPSVGNATILGR